jgi:hypothetical protein
MRLSRALTDKLHDKRLRDKLLAEGKISHAQLEEYLNSLADDEGNLTHIDIASTGNSTTEEAAPDSAEPTLS